MSIDFIDLKAQQRRIKHEIDAAIAKVLAGGQYSWALRLRRLKPI